MTEANTHPISDRRVWTASVISAVGWGCGWLVCMIVLMSSYFDLQGAIRYCLLFGGVGITATVIGLWIVRVHLPFIRIVLLYAMWGISNVGIVYRSLANAPNNIVGILLVQIFIFSLTIRWILLQSVDGFAQQDRGNIVLGWIIGLGLPLAIGYFLNDFAYWLYFAPLVICLTGSFGSAVMFWRIQRAQCDRLMMPDDEQVEPTALGQLMQSPAQQATFEVVHDTGKPKAKRKPKPAWWSSIPHLRVYMAGLALVVVLAIGISLLITPVREVRVPGFITPNPTNSTPGPKWGNRLPPTNPRWHRNAFVVTNSPVGNIAANEAVYLGDSYYDFGADMWWYKAASLDGNTGDAWEWQINPSDVFQLTITAVTLVPAGEWTATFSPTKTPIKNSDSLDTGGYHVTAQLFDGTYWQYTLQAADGSSQTVDASALGPEFALTPSLSVPFMDKVGTMQAELITREAIDSIPAGSPVQLIKIIWYEGRAPVYLITPDISNPQAIVAEASAEQLEARP